MGRKPFRPKVTFENSILRLALRDAAVVTTRDIEVVIDVDEFGDPSGLEIIGICEVLGENALVRLAENLDGSEIRFSYDGAIDTVALGVGIAAGSRVRESVPKLGRAGLDAEGRWVTLDVA